MIDYREINHRTMVNTLTLCESIQELRDSIVHSTAGQKVYWEQNQMHPHGGKGYPTRIIVSNRTTLDATKQYIGSKIAVLNFANNHSVFSSVLDQLFKIFAEIIILRIDERSFYASGQENLIGVSD